MDAVQIARYAGSLYRAHGDRAEAEAARRIRDCEAAGKTREAHDWREIRAAIHQRRPVRQG